MQYNLRLGDREQVAFIRIMPNLLAVLTKNYGALEEEVAIASAAIGIRFQSLLGEHPQIHPRRFIFVFVLYRKSHTQKLGFLVSP
jgi:hypothetical protein